MKVVTDNEVPEDFQINHGMLSINKNFCKVLYKPSVCHNVCEKAMWQHTENILKHKVTFWIFCNVIYNILGINKVMKVLQRILI